MKNLLVFLCAMVLVFGVVGTANSTLWDRGGGLIYDDVLDITWLQDANHPRTSQHAPFFGRMRWDDAVAWADGLEYYDPIRNTTWDDWRLPHVMPVDGASHNLVTTYDGSTDRGYNIGAPGTIYEGSTASELAFMYYCNLGNFGLYDISGNEPQPGWGLQNEGPFINLDIGYWWSGTEYQGGELPAFSFSFGIGRQGDDSKGEMRYAWAVMDGDVSVVPIPSAIWLLGSGLIGLVGFRKKFNKN